MTAMHRMVVAHARCCCSGDTVCDRVASAVGDLDNASDDRARVRGAVIIGLYRQSHLCDKRDGPSSSSALEFVGGAVRATSRALKEVPGTVERTQHPMRCTVPPTIYTTTNDRHHAADSVVANTCRGKTVAIASGKPVSPSTNAINLREGTSIVSRGKVVNYSIHTT